MITLEHRQSKTGGWLVASGLLEEKDTPLINIADSPNRAIPIRIKHLLAKTLDLIISTGEARGYNRITPSGLGWGCRLWLIENVEFGTWRVA